jgi:hypothetical protein
VALPLPPPLVPEGGTHSLAGEGAGPSQFQRGDRHCDTTENLLHEEDETNIVVVIQKEITDQNNYSTFSRYTLRDQNIEKYRLVREEKSTL